MITHANYKFLTVLSFIFSYPDAVEKSKKCGVRGIFTTLKWKSSANNNEEGGGGGGGTRKDQF